MLEFFFLRVLHDGTGLGVLLHGRPLLVPVDGFGLLDERDNHAGKSSHLVRQLVRRFVILLEAHRGTPSRYYAARNTAPRPRVSVPGRGRAARDRDRAPPQRAAARRRTAGARYARGRGNTP